MFVMRIRNSIVYGSTMSLFRLFFLGILFFSHGFLESSQNKAVTYTFSGGRFGDNLLAYMHAKWVSVRYGIPLLYKPFPHSESLNMDMLEPRYQEMFSLHYVKKVILGRGSLVEERIRAPTLYIVPYFPESSWERTHGLDGNGKAWPYLLVDWDDEFFFKTLQKMISPRYEMSQIKVPSDRISVALHARRGGGFDDENVVENFPLKFPPEQFYITAIRYIYEKFGHKGLYVYIFTDDSQPSSLLDFYQKKFEDCDITWDCRKNKNSHSTNVVEDFFSLTKFDCIIHGESNFSVCASKIHRFKIDIQPHIFHWENKKPVVDQMKVKNFLGDMSDKKYENVIVSS